ncbi:ras guanine nucleotide exchange factor domain-containing protein [Russula emetica]|nr:ras guanine nucleotide exchange factor domain-containing protein [Russula emetica]
MSPQNIVPVTGLTDVSGSGLLIASSLINAAKNVKIYRVSSPKFCTPNLPRVLNRFFVLFGHQSQCEHLGKQCLDLASALRDHSDKLEGTAAQQAVDEAERVLTHILNRVRKWEDLGKMRSFVKQTEIRMGLDESYRELKACSMRFNITLHLNASSRGRELEEIRRRDHEELVEMMTKILHDKSLLKMTLATSTREDAHNVELREADVGETQERQLQEDFGELRRWVERLPPMVDLSGKVIRTSDHPIASGGSQDIYTGEWTGQEVALAYPRNQSRAGREGFQRQVEIWRTLRHPNILQLLGIASIGDFVYSVSPYMEFGHVTRFLKAHPDADRVLLLSEIASATEYLHMNGIIHGDLQGSNVLISRDGHACLGDLGTARVEERPLLMDHLRWLAPELVADSRYVPTTRATDVCHVSNEAFIPLVIRDGPLPTRPEHANTRRLSDAMWNLMNQCWQRDPKSRPSMSEIRETIQNIHPMRIIFSVHAAGVPGGARPSGLTMSRPSGSTGLTPPKAPVPMPKSLARDEPELEQSQRGNPASFPMRKYPTLYIPLSSSPPSGLTLSPRSVPGKSMPYPQNRSPLSSGFRTPLPSTTPESRMSVSSPSDHSDWSLKPPLLLPDPTTSESSNADLSLLLQPIVITPSSRSGSIDGHRRIGSTSTGSIQSIDKCMSTSSSGGLLRPPFKIQSPLLRRTADGTVEAGTLVALTDRLIKDTHDRAKDDEFRRVFFATYPLFTTGEDLFRSLKRRFEEMGDVQSFIPSGSSRYSTLLVLRTWLEDGGEHWSRGLLSSISEFARSIGGSDTMKTAVQEIANLANEKMNVVVVSPTPSLQPSHGTTLPSSSLEQFKPEDIADSLTVIEGEFYSKITQADYIAHVRRTPITTHIASASEVNNRLVNWVKLHIISYKDVNRRSTKFKYFVLIAEECRKSQNFSSMSAIVAALQSLSQLILTCDIGLTKNEKQLLAQLGDILAPESDHLAYRQAIQNIKSPIAIPWFAVHLRSLQTFYDRSSSTVIIDQRPLINFIRCAKLLQRIDDIGRYHPAPSPLADPQAGKAKDKSKSKTKTKDKDKRRSSGTAPASLAWVKKELDNAPSVISLEPFEALVSELVQAERQSHERHEPELRFLGFAPPTTPTPRHHRPTSSPGSPSSRLSLGAGRKVSLESRPGKT